MDRVKQDERSSAELLRFITGGVSLGVMKQGDKSDAQFRGWTKPGPRVAGPIAVRANETLDAISGWYRLLQLKDGHRFSTDDILTAWYGTSWCPRAETVLDLGSGIGSVATTAAWRLPAAKFVTVEAQAESVELAKRSAAYNELTERFDIRLGDFREASVLRPEEKFDLVLGSPPYFPLGSGVLGDHPQKVACRFEMRGDIRDYCTTASRQLAPGGWFACIFPAEAAQEARVRVGMAQAGLVAIRRRPIVLLEGEPPLLALWAMMLAADVPEWMRAVEWLEPPLVIRTKGGAIHPEYSAVKMTFGFPP